MKTVSDILSELLFKLEEDKNMEINTTKVFQPVIITLESEDEVKMFLELLISSDEVSEDAEYMLEELIYDITELTGIEPTSCRSETNICDCDDCLDAQAFLDSLSL